MSIHTLLDPKAGITLPPGLCALGVMTKAPQPGKVKTRLTPPLTPEEAAQLNTKFLRDISRSISLACGQSASRGVAIYTPVGAEASYKGILPADFFLLPQRGDLFGERLLFAAEDLFQVGFESVCLINSDSPTVPPASFIEAANKLAKSGDRTIIGPAADGGYYLIGLKKLHRRLFEEINWSTERVFEQTRQRASEIGIEVHELSRGLDVDDAATLCDLCQELFGRDTLSTKDVAPETRRFLNAIIEREGHERIWPKM